MLKKATLETGLRRLEKLADFLEKLPSGRFYYGHWIDTEKWEGAADLSCGTTACALGWGTAIPSFRKAGLRMKKHGLPAFGKSEGMDAGARFFGITHADALFIFQPNALHAKDLDLWSAPGHDATPKQVAKHIRSFVAWKRSE